MCWDEHHTQAPMRATSVMEIGKWLNGSKSSLMVSDSISGAKVLPFSQVV